MSFLSCISDDIQNRKEKEFYQIEECFSDKYEHFQFEIEPTFSTPKNVDKYLKNKVFSRICTHGTPEPIEVVYLILDQINNDFSRDDWIEQEIHYINENVVDLMELDTSVSHISKPNDNVLEGEAALRLYQDLMHPKRNPKKTRLIEESEEMFPEPGKPAKITIEFTDEEVKFLESL